MNTCTAVAFQRGKQLYSRDKNGITPEDTYDYRSYFRIEKIHPGKRGEF